MIEYVCFDPDCPFRSLNRFQYAIHLYEAHTGNEPGVNRDNVVQRIMDQQGYNRPVRPPDDTRLPVSGGMRRRPVDYDDEKRDIW